MYKLTRSLMVLLLTITVGEQTARVSEAEAGVENDKAASPLYSDGLYATSLAHVAGSEGPLDIQYGGSVGVGLRKGLIGFEINARVSRSHSATLFGGTVDGLAFPLSSLPGLFVITGVGVTNVRDYPDIGNTAFNITTLDGGAGYLFPLQIGDYHFGLRTLAVFEYGKREKRSQEQRPPADDLPVRSTFQEVVASVGLQFPFGHVVTSAPEEPVAVVPIGPVSATPP